MLMRLFCWDLALHWRRVRSNRFSQMMPMSPKFITFTLNF